METKNPLNGHSLEDIKINVIRDMCSCSDQMQPYAKPVNYSTKSWRGNNRRSRGRDRKW